MINKWLLIIKRTGILSAFSLFPVISYSQHKPLSCKNIMQGVFYYYPKNSSDQYLERMDGKFNHEKNLISGDTTLCRVKWENDCTFSSKYITGNTKMTVQMLTFLQKHTLIYKIVDTKKAYFTFKLYVDKTTSFPLLEDTIWVRPKAHPTNEPLFSIITSPSLLKREHFSDTSHYAVLYLYRPGKFSNSMNLYPVYLNNIKMSIIVNNSGYIFKLLKEGNFEIKSTLFGHSYTMKLPVQFGHTYYLRSKVHWGMTRNRNHIEMKIVDPKTGREEFGQIKRKYF